MRWCILVIVWVAMIVAGGEIHVAAATKYVTPPGYYPVPVSNSTPKNDPCYYGCHTGDAATDPSVVLEPDTGSGDMGTLAAGPWRYKLNIPGDTYCYNWATVRNYKSSFAMGLASEAVPAGGCYPETGAWTFDVTYRSSNFVHYFGYAYGDFQHCGWILAQNLDPKSGTPSALCPNTENPTIDPSTFQLTYNSQPYNDGVDVALKPGAWCGAYADVQPWANPTNPTHLLKWPYAPPNDTPRVYVGGMVVKWRYVTKYPPYYVMVRDARFGENNGEGNWEFIYRWCFDALPYEVAR